MENIENDSNNHHTTNKTKRSKKSKIKNSLEFTAEEKIIIEKLSAEVEELNHSITSTTVSNNNTEPNRKKHRKKNSSTSSENHKKQKKIYIEEKDQNDNNKVNYPTSSFIIYKKDNDSEKSTKRKYKKLKSPFKYNNDPNQNSDENIKIKENLPNKPRTQKKIKNTLLKKKIKPVILKKLNGTYLKIFYFDKWFRITYETPNGDEDYEIYNQNDEEEQNKNYQISNTNYNNGIKMNNYTAENEEIEQEEDIDEEKVYKPNDLEEIEERPVDEEESVVASSVQGKTIINGSNAILFSLRKIIKYKNKLYCYFMKWYRGKGKVNIPSVEFKKIRKGRKISGGLQKSSNSSTGSNINTPIPEDESEKYTNEKIDVIKKNMKNFILLGGDKNKILKKYYDIWFDKTFKQNKNKNSRNEYIFTYQYQNSSESNLNSKNNEKSQNEMNSTFKNNNNEFQYNEEDSSKNDNNLITENSNSSNKINNNSYTQIRIKKNQDKKNSKEKKKSISKSKTNNKLSNDSTNIHTNPSNSSSLEKKLVKKKKLKKKDMEDKSPSEEYNNIKIRNNNSTSDKNSDNNSLTTSLPSGSIEMFENSKDSKEYKAKKKSGKRKILKKEGKGLKVVVLNSDKEEEEYDQAFQKKHIKEDEKQKILEKIKKICKIHKNNKAQRYLFIKRPKMKKIKNISIDRKKGSNNINNGIQLEDIQKRFYKLLLKTTCRKDPLMLCFDKWFDITYNQKDYIPFLRKFKQPQTEATKRKSSKKSKDKKIDTSNNDSSSSNLLIKKNRSVHKRESSPLLSHESYNDNKNRSKKKSPANKLIDDEYYNIGPDSDGQLSDNDLSYKKHVLGDDIYTRKVSESWNYSGSSKKNKKVCKKLKNNKFHKVKFSMDSKDDFFNSDNNIHCYKDIKINFKSFNSSFNNNKQDNDSKKTSKKEILSYETNNTYNYPRSNTKDAYENIINNYLEKREVNYSREEEINPDVQDIEIMQEDDTETNENDKKSKSKDSKSEEKDTQKSEEKITQKNDEKDIQKNEEKDIIKIYKNAFHLLRKAIKSYAKRIKRTFNPDCALKIHFLKWVNNVFYESLEEYRIKRDENIKKQKIINELKNILEMINEKQNNELKKYYFNKWYENITLSNFKQIEINNTSEIQKDYKESKNIDDFHASGYAKQKKITNDEMITANSDNKRTRKKVTKPIVPNININKLRNIKSQEDIVLNRSSSYPMQKAIALPKIKIKKQKIMETEGEGLLDITDIEVSSSERKKQSKKKHKKNIDSNNKEKNKRDSSRKEKNKKKIENLNEIKKNLNNEKIENNDIDKNDLEQLKQELSLNIKMPNLNYETINYNNKNDEEYIEEENPNKIENPSQILIMDNEIDNQKSTKSNIIIDEKKLVNQNENEEKNEKVSSSRLLLIKELLKRDKLKYSKNYSLKNIYNKKYKKSKNPKIIEKFVLILENFIKNLLEKQNKLVFNMLNNTVCGNKYSEIEINSITSEKIIKNNEQYNCNDNNFIEKNDFDDKTEFITNTIVKKTKIINGNRNIYVSKKKKLVFDGPSNCDEMKSDTEETEPNLVYNRKSIKIPKNVKQSDNKIYKSQKSNFIKISKLNDSINQFQNLTLDNLKKYNFINNVAQTNDFDPYIILLKEHNKKMQVYHLYYLYMLYNNNIDFYLKRKLFNKWRTKNKVFKKPILKRHMKSILVKNLLKTDNKFKCSCSENDMCLNCDCVHLQVKLKKILIRYKFMKLTNPIRYYFYLWYKRTFWKVLPVYLYENE